MTERGMEYKTAYVENIRIGIKILQQLVKRQSQPFQRLENW